MSSEPTHFACPVCESTGLVRFKRTIGQIRNMPWTKACRCGHGDRYAEFMDRVTEESFRMAAGRTKVAA